jgi:hypothetical protein
VHTGTYIFDVISKTHSIDQGCKGGGKEQTLLIGLFVKFHEREDFNTLTSMSLRIAWD